MKLKEVLDEMLNEVAIDQLRTQYVDSGKMPSTVFDKIIDAANKKSAYATWLAKRVLTRVIKIEDIEKYKDYLNVFDRNKREYPASDINFYKDSNKIEDFNSKSIEIINKETDPSQQKGIPFEQKYAKLKIGTVADFDIYKIPQGSEDSHQTSCDLGSGTGWCTATGKTNTLFKGYIMKDDLYILIDKKDKTNKYQFHYADQQFMDRNDVPILAR
jgi:hypothetical protein